MSEPRPARVRRVWTERELDAALAELGGEPGVNERAVGLARARLAAASRAATSTSASAAACPRPQERMTTMQRLDQQTLDQDDLADRRASRAEAWAPARRRVGRRWAVAAAAAVVAAGVLVAQTVPFNNRLPVAVATADPRAVLGSAADLQVATDDALRAGQYRHVTTRAWWTVGSEANSGFRYLAEHVTETWIPADPSQEWGLRRTTTGRRQWQLGDEAAARKAGIRLDDGWPQGTWRAKGGRFVLPGPEDEVKLSRLSPAERAKVLADQARPVPPSWQNPTPEWLGGLPADPAALRERLLADVQAAGKRFTGAALDARALGAVADALRSGLVPAKLRATMYEALAGLASLQVTERQANLDGSRGIALGVDDGAIRHEIIIDSGNGQFIGERLVTTRAEGTVPAGTVSEFTSVTTEVVDSIPSDV